MPEPILTRLAARGRVLVVKDDAHHLHEAIRRETGEPLNDLAHPVSAPRAGRGRNRRAAGLLGHPTQPRRPTLRRHCRRLSAVGGHRAGHRETPGHRRALGCGRGTVEAASDDASVRYRQRISAGVAKWREFRDALAPAKRNPLLFVMAENTHAADQIARYLETLSDLAGKVLTIHVNIGGRDKGEISKSDLENARRWAREVGSDDNPYAAIVSVLMLREAAMFATCR